MHSEEECANAEKQLVLDKSSAVIPDSDVSVLEDWEGEVLHDALVVGCVWKRGEDRPVCAVLQRMQERRAMNPNIVAAHGLPHETGAGLL